MMQTVEKVIEGHDVYDTPEPVPPHLAFASWFYACGRIGHRALYATGIKKRNRLPKPVICVGNLTVGGTGKTPFLVYLANEIRRRGLSPVILSRGYGAKPPAETPRIVSDGLKIENDAARNGDEPTLIALRCAGVPVVIGSSRFDAGVFALQQFKRIDLFLLDDGFQHEALARDADLVLWDVRDRPSRMHQLPAGRLREGLGGLRRASAILLTHAEYLPEHMRPWLIDEAVKGIKRYAPHAPVFTAETLLSSVHWIGEEADARDVSVLAGRRVVLLSGLARPEGFETLAKDAGIEVVEHLKHSDHAAYTQEDLRKAAEAAQKTKADAILTTEKDEVKLRALDASGLNICVASLEMRVSEGERWSPYMDGLVKKC